MTVQVYFNIEIGNKYLALHLVELDREIVGLQWPRCCLLECVDHLSWRHNPLLVNLDIDSVGSVPFEGPRLNGEDVPTRAHLHFGGVRECAFWRESDIIRVALVTEPEGQRADRDLLVGSDEQRVTWQTKLELRPVRFGPNEAILFTECFGHLAACHTADKHSESVELVFDSILLCIADRDLQDGRASKFVTMLLEIAFTFPVESQAVPVFVAKICEPRILRINYDK